MYQQTPRDTIPGELTIPEVMRQVGEACRKASHPEKPMILVMRLQTMLRRQGKAERDIPACILAYCHYVYRLPVLSESFR